MLQNQTISGLTVRRLLIDLKRPIERHWFGNDAFRTALFNALSMGFPPGEQMFIDSVRASLKALPQERQIIFKQLVSGFIGQEATHRHIHALFNWQIVQHGLVNAWLPRAQRRLKRMEGTSHLNMLALTAAYEHFTALLAEWLLQHQDAFNGCDDHIKAMWLWHSAEEVEHKSVAFDLYIALGGGRVRRLFWFVIATLVFTTDALHQTVSNLSKDKSLWMLRTWSSAASFLFGRNGVLRHSLFPWAAYLGKNFHPSQSDSPFANDWLHANAGSFAIVQKKPE